MSTVTDILLTTCLAEGLDPMPDSVAKLSAWLVEHQGPANALIRLDQYAGGDKHMQAFVFGAAVNYLDTEGFLRAFRETKWEYPERVQLLLKGEHDDAFGLYNAVAGS